MTPLDAVRTMIALIDEHGSRTTRPSPAPTETDIDAGTALLSDPDHVRMLVRGVRGIHFAEPAEAEGIRPFWKNRRGMAFDELVTSVAAAQQQPERTIRDALLSTMRHYETLLAAKRARGIETEDDRLRHEIDRADAAAMDEIKDEMRRALAPKGR